MPKWLISGLRKKRKPSKARQGRKKRQKMADYLPQELLIKILHRLPIKSLIRCTSICKTWYNLITSSNFISTHLNHNIAQTTTISNNNNTHILLRSFVEDPETDHHDDSTLKYEGYVGRYTLYHDNETFDEYADLSDDFPFFTPNWYYRIIGSCNGLVCLSDDEFTYRHCTVIWNPCIKRWVSLPRPIFTFTTHGPFMHVFGFGFDPVKNDYKVVRLVYLESHEIPAKVEIYRLSCGIWEDISHVELRYEVCEKYPQAYLNGVVHWVGKERDWSHLYSYFLVSFDMGNEVFGRMELPYDVAIDFHFNPPDLLMSKGSLYVVHWIYSDNSRVLMFDLWMMKEYGVAESWSKQFNVAVSGLMAPLGFRHNGELLWVLEQYVVSYDPKSKQTKDLGISGYTGGLHWRSFHAVTFVESLVLLDRRMDLSDFDIVLGNQEKHESCSNSQGKRKRKRKNRQVKSKRKNRQVKSKRKNRAED